VSSFGFPTVSAKIAFVFFVSAFRKFAGAFGSTNFTSIPILGNVLEKRLYVPPYNDAEEMISSPERAMFRSARVSAAWPDATARAPVPPSSCAIRCSKTSVVGFIIRV
jgi:hypothetical protein